MPVWLPFLKGSANFSESPSIRSSLNLAKCDVLNGKEKKNGAEIAVRRGGLCSV